MLRLGGPPAAAVVIPARNEAQRLPACLAALRDAVRLLDRPVLAVVVVNDSDDGTAAVARAHLAASDLQSLVIERHDGAGVGAARALGHQAALDHCAETTPMLGTDADSRVDRLWLLQMLAELDRADLVFGQVLPDPEELAALGDRGSRHDATEGRYMQAAVRLAAALDPLPHDPDPAHRNATGANYGLRAATLARIGGFPRLRLSEDRTLARQAERFDLRVRHAAAPQVVTSFRLWGRAEGGMASTLRARLDAPDPPCDDWLEPADRFVFRHRLRAALRRCWPDPAALRVTLQAAGVVATDQPMHHTTFGAFWQDLEQAEPLLERLTLRQSQAARELPILQRHLDGALAAAAAKKERAS